MAVERERDSRGHGGGTTTYVYTPLRAPTRAYPAVAVRNSGLAQQRVRNSGTADRNNGGDDPPDDQDDDPSGWGPGTIGAAENPGRRVRCPACGWKDKTVVAPGGQITCHKCGHTYAAG